MPSWELFAGQPAEYRYSVLPPDVAIRISVEAGTSIGWERYTTSSGAQIGIDEYGASAPGDEVMAHYGFTVDDVLTKARRLLQSSA